MKRTFLFGGAALSLFMVSCQSDDLQQSPGGNVGPSTDIERTFYVNLNLRTDGNDMSRAAIDDGNPVVGNKDFDKGTGESNVKNAYFVFYDQSGNPVGNAPVKVDLSSAEWTEEANGSSIDKYYKSVVGVTIGNNDNNPAQVICYLNPQDPNNLYKALSEIQAEERPDFRKYDEDGTTYFSMSNSVYYTSTASDAPQIAVPIAPDQLFNTRAAAEAAMKDDAMTIDIYVERYAAKLTFNAVDATDFKSVTRPATTGPDVDVSLKFVPKTWILNASCPKTYIIKSFREEDASSGDMLTDNYGYEELNSVLNKNNGGWAWNNADLHRSYWAMSPAYFTAEYPEVSYDVNTENPDKLNIYQHYYSYDELIKANGELNLGFRLPVGNNAVTEYVHETTVGSKALASRNIVAALASVIYVGDYTITLGTKELPKGTDFYTYGVVSNESDHPVVYFDVADSEQGRLNGVSAVDGGESILRALIKGATNLYKQISAPDGSVKYVNFDLKNSQELEKLVAVLELADLNKPENHEIKGNLKIPERYRTLRFKEGVTEEQLTGIYVGTAQGYRTIEPVEKTPEAGEITLLTANQELMKVVGYACKYSAGAAYFNIPVKHLGWYRTGNLNKGKDEINWADVRVGDFGVVRNHSYTINVSELTGLGTGIGSKSNPIVPPSVENRYYIAYRVNILQWAIVPTQNVKL